MAKNLGSFVIGMLIGAALDIAPFDSVRGKQGGDTRVSEAADASVVRKDGIQIFGH
jgi:hypothetical protein